MSKIVSSKYEELSQEDVAKILQEGGVGVLPTDTLYGVVARALDEKAVEKVYAAKERDRKKPCIILLSDVDDLYEFGINVYDLEREILNVLWPGHISVVMDCSGEGYSYLHKGMHSLAFRIPNVAWLQTLLRKTGPLVAPSANPEDMKVASDISMARDYFDEKMDFYWDGGSLTGQPSTLIKLLNNAILIKRDGAVDASDVKKMLRDARIEVPVIRT